MPMIGLILSQYWKPLALVVLIAAALAYRSVLIHQRDEARVRSRNLPQRQPRCDQQPGLGCQHRSAECSGDRAQGARRCGVEYHGGRMKRRRFVRAQARKGRRSSKRAR